MTNPAAEARTKIQAQWPGASISARGRNSITHQHPTEPGRFALDTSIGPLHYGSDKDQEIDTAWESGELADQPWLWKMVKNDFNVFLGPGTTEFDAGQIVRYVHPDSGEDITFEVQQLQWTNNLNQIEAIADPQKVGHTSLEDDKVTWSDAFGPGLDFSWQIQTARLAKYLTIQNAGAIGSPPQFIIDGGNPVLRLQFIFQKSSGVQLWVNGTAWDEKANNPVTTSDNVEFRLESTSEPLWWFKMPSAEDNSENGPPQLIQRFRKTGPNLFVEVLIPWSWLQSAIYPVIIDPTVDEQIGTGAGDANDRADSSGWNSNGSNVTLASDTSANQRWWGGFHFPGVTVDGTIDTAYFEVYFYHGSGRDPNGDLHFEDEDSPGNFSGGSSGDIVNANLTAASVAWGDGTDQGAGWFGSALEIKTVVQEIVDRVGWSSGNDMVVIWQPKSDADYVAYARAYDGDSATAAKLHIEYSTGGTTYEQAAAGTLTTAGIYSLLVSLSYAGALTSAGGLVSQAQKTLAGALTSAGALSSQGQKALVGSLSSAGTLAKTTILSHAGTLTSAGTISAIKTFLQALAGTLTSSGVLSKLSAKQLLGSLSSSGTIAKAITLSYAGRLNSSGTLSAVKTFLLALSGFLLGSGSNFGLLSKKSLLSYSGTLTSSGTSVKTMAASFAGSLSSSGTVLKNTILSYAGSLATAGAMATIKNAVVETIDLTLNSRSVSFLLNARSTAMTLVQRAIDFTVDTRD